MRQYYNSATNTYDFQENGQPLSILILMNNFITKASIKAKDIIAKNINCNSITAGHICVDDIGVNNTLQCEMIIADNIKSYILNAASVLANYVDCTHIYVTIQLMADEITGKYIDVKYLNAFKVQGNILVVEEKKPIYNSLDINIDVNQLIIKL